MELHRSRRSLPLAVVCVVAGLVLLLFSPAGALLGHLAGLAGTVLGGAVIVGALRPFRLHVGPDGLAVRRRGIDRLIRWDEIDAVVLDRPVVGDPPPPAHLLLVPAPTARIDLPAATGPYPDRPAVLLVRFDEIRETPEQLAQALADIAGDRFVDADRLWRDTIGVDRFSTSLRGYDIDTTGELLRQLHHALLWGDGPAREAARDLIDRTDTTPLRRANRGWFCLEVDTALIRLRRALAEPPPARRPPAARPPIADDAAARPAGDQLSAGPTDARPGDRPAAGRPAGDGSSPDATA